VAQPGTITGSIGVLSGKIVSAGFLDKFLFHRETIGRGQHIAFYDMGQPFSEEERKIVWESIKRTYDVFLDHVAAGRKMTKEAADSVGGGRVWTGRQALERGLVDELGGLDKALAKARQLANLHSRAQVHEIRVGKRLIAPIPERVSLIHYAMEGLSMFNRARTSLCLCPLIWHDLSNGL
jgi:protease-4